MKTTLSNAENMQSATGIDALASPPTPACTSFTPQVALGGERSKDGDRALASLWIRRLKPREEPESLKGETFASDIEKRQGLHAENSDSGSSSPSFGSHLQEASSTKTWENKALSKIEKLDEERFLKHALNKQISSSERQDCVGERQQNFVEQGRGRIVPFTTPYTSGFGQQVNQIADAKYERKLPTKLMTVDMNVNSRYTSEAAMILHTCSPATESKSQVSHAVRMQAEEGGISASSLGKPPLPPSHNKSGFPPRPAGHKSLSFSEWSAGKISNSPTYNKLAAIPLQDIVRHPSHITVMKGSLSATNASARPLAIEERQAKEDGMGCQDPLSKEKVVPSVEPVMRHLPVPSSEGKSFLTYKPPKKIARQDFEATDVIALGTESLNGLETGEQAFRTLLKESTIPKSPSECSVGSTHADETMEAAPSASSTAKFPWEMFAGAAGPSRTAREEFVEVYNRARNELKNHKSSSLITKVFHKEMENCPGFAFGDATCIRDTLIVEHEGQASDPEIPENLSKAEGVDYVSQAGGMKGEVDIYPGKTSQAFHSVHVTSGKESSLFMRGQSGGPLHGHKKSRLTVGRSSQWQGFASSTMPERTHRELLQPTLVDQTDGVSHDNSKTQPGMFDSSPVNKKETLMVLGKSQLGMFDGSPKESLQLERLPRKSDVWLQRWYPPYISSIKGSQEHKIPESNRLGQDLAGCSVGNVRKAKESDEHGACAKEDLKKRLIEKGILFQRIRPGAEPEHFKTSSKKVLPSAAAMAIVGTAAKQFCTVQPQHKGSFAFWSGFGMPAPQTPEHFTEKGKQKLTFEADPSPQP